MKRAIDGSRRLAARHMRHLLGHSHRHCSPLVVALLQLDLLSGRLPPEHQPEKQGSMGFVLAHG